jgi:tetratricopeptide (TPR) repeat protein
MNKRFSSLMVLVLLTAFLSCNTTKKVATIPTNTQDIGLEKEKSSIHDKLLENSHLSINDRIALYHHLKNTEPNTYNFENEHELNRYGYALLTEEKTKEAIEIFKLLVSEFPKSYNPYDSLGEAYLQDGNEEKSLLNYQKSLELNPKNTRAIDQINRMLGLELLVTDWGKEIFHFPIHFAPEIPYEGIEEVVFPKNWIKPDSTDFWSYVFIWALDNKTEITAVELELTMKLYFDGLMAVVNDDKDAEMIKTEAYFQENTNVNDDIDFTGHIRIFDAFATNEPLELNARIHSNYCAERGKLLLLFHFSPQDFNQAIWDKLRTVKVREDVCDN